MINCLRLSALIFVILGFSFSQAQEKKLEFKLKNENAEREDVKRDPQSHDIDATEEENEDSSVEARVQAATSR